MARFQGRRKTSVRKTVRTKSWRKPSWKKPLPTSIPRMLSSNVLNVKRQFYAGRVIPSTATTLNFWCYVTPTLQSAGIMSSTTLAGLPNLTEYTNLFDTFKLAAIKYRFVPRNMDYNLSQVNPSTGTTFFDVPQVSILKDPQSTVSPSGVYGITSYNTLLEQGNVRRVRGDKEFSVYLKPLIQEQYGSGALRYIKPRYTGTDASGVAMPHRGFHIYWHNFNFSTTFTEYDVYVTYYMSFKGQK